MADKRKTTGHRVTAAVEFKSAAEREAAVLYADDEGYSFSDFVRLRAFQLPALGSGGKSKARKPSKKRKAAK
ncbi:MAG TPA: hypothetical protein VFD58_00905 [Blastocatellia bacterium]|nr:hypothetical protein [Blastocatellia bacterium]